MERVNKRKRLKIGSFMLLIFVLIYVPSLLFWVYGKTISTDIIRIGTLEQSINADAYIVRDEEVLKSSIEGKCIAEANEGEKVPVNSRVATVLKGTSIKLLDDMKKKDMDILKAQREKSENQEMFSEDTAKIDNEIKQKILQIVGESNSNNFSQIMKYKDDINGLIEKKASIFGSKSTSDTYINSLKSEKEKLQNQINSNTKEIFTSTSGIISYVIDGYEGILTPSAIKNFTPKFLNDLKPEKAVRTVTNGSVEYDKPFAKVIKNIESYIVVVLDADKAKQFGVDDQIDIRINDIAKVIHATINYKSEEQDGKYILSLKINRGISETVSLRKVNIDLIRSFYTGLKVPLKSLKNINTTDMTAEIVLVKANCARIKKVKIVGKNEEFAIVKSLDKSDESSLSLYDIYVLNYENIQEGQLINQ